MAISIKGKLNTGLLAAAVVAAGLCLGMTVANATTISASVGGVPTGANCYQNFDSLPTGINGSTGGSVGTGACSFGVSFSPNAQAVTGYVNGLYARPFLSNNNGALFGDNHNGADGTVYLTSGADGGSLPNAAATLTFSSPEQYFGLLWGSVDNYNTLTFYMGSNSVASFTGADVANAATPGTCTGNGNQTLGGTCYVNINLSSAFDRVVATSSSYAFEFDNVAFSTNQVGVPEPGEIGLFLLGLLLIGSGYWYQKRKSV